MTITQLTNILYQAEQNLQFDRNLFGGLAKQYTSMHYAFIQSEAEKIRVIAELNEEINKLNGQVDHMAMNMQEIEKELNIVRNKFEREKRVHSRTQSAKDAAKSRLSRLLCPCA